MNIDIEEEDVPPDVLVELVTKHGQPLRILRTMAGTVVVRLVNQTTFIRWRGMVAEKKSTHDASVYMALNACVWPDRPTLQGMLAKYPGIAIKVQNCAVKMVGLDGEDDEGKAVEG